MLARSPAYDPDPPLDDRMRALILKRYGGPDATELWDDVPTPVAWPGEVLVRVRAAGLNPVGFKTREGKLKLIYRYPLPAIHGADARADGA